MPPGKKGKHGNGPKSSNKRPGASLKMPDAKRPKILQKKGKARSRVHIDVPEGEELVDPDMVVDEDVMGSSSFLQRLDQKSISVSKRVIEQIRKAEKPRLPKAKPAPIDLDSAATDDDDDAWSSTLESLPSGSGGHDDNSSEMSESDEDSDDGDLEMRHKPATWDNEQPEQSSRLPVKLPDGTIRLTGSRPIQRTPSPEASDDEAAVENTPRPPSPRRDDFATGARFGRPAVVDVLTNGTRKGRVQRAKEEIAIICQDIVGDAENGLGLLRRLHTYTLDLVSSPTHPEPVPNDPIIRKLAILSEMAVFKDIIPGYRIRAITEAEKAQKTSQLVLRQRDFEQGLLSAYQQYLKMLEHELKIKSDIAETALQCMCTLLTDLTHFNFRVNIMNSVVAHLSKRSWDNNSDLCLTSIIAVFRNDQSGAPSLELVRILNRMIKERRYRVHPNVLSCLLHLRLRNELQGIRASERGAFKDTKSEKKPKVKMTKKEKKVAKPHLSKKAKQAQKELKEIEEEMAEATMEVDAEERANQHTETLKLLFVLYFSIIKNPRPTRLLSGALEGISRYAHLVNIDFFRDLLSVLKSLVLRHEKQSSTEEESGDEEDIEENELPKEPSLRYRELLRRRLLCITTAFELLTGQGDAITIDLGDFVNYLYAIILELATVPDVEKVPTPTSKAVVQTEKGELTASRVEAKSLADLLFRTVYIVFSPRASAGSIPPWRTAAFAKRILISSLSWPSATVLRALEFVEAMLVKEPKLEALLSTEEQTADGVFRGDLDDPQLCNAFASNFYELRLLAGSHWDETVRKEALQLTNYVRS